MDRPSSAQSRRAWDHDNMGVVNPGGPTLDEDDDIMPRAMESEAYGGVKGKNGQVANVQPAQPTGPWGTFKKGIRSIWATRQTEETEHDKELHIKTTLRELIIYCIFLTVLCIITFGMTSSTMFYYTNVLNNLFIQTPGDPTNQGSNFLGIGQPADWFDFAEKVLVPGLFTDWESWYNGVNISANSLGYVYYENKLMGVPRIRQLRVRSDSCTVPSDFQDQIKVCYGGYSSGAEDKSPYGLGNGTAWTYHSSKELDGSSYTAIINSYNGGGYYQDLAIDSGESSDLIKVLHDNLWIDRGTRVVFVDFTVYNANINLFCVIKLVVEFPPTGGAIPSFTFRTVKLLRYVSAMDYFVLACECIFCVFIFYYIVEEILEIKRYRFSYLKGFWNVLDIIVILISICCIAFNVYRTIAINNKLEGLLGKPDDFADFDFLSYWQVVFNSALAIMVFFAWIKIFKYISFNKTMTQLSTTLNACAKDLVGFAIMFFIVFLAFAQLGYLIFGTQVADFNKFETAIFTLFRIILGDFDFQALQQANRVLGPAYFILYVFFVFFVLLNMFLAIINDTYSEVKADLSNQENEFEMADYFKQGYYKMMSKLNRKRDRIFEIQNVLRSADRNQDNHIDFEEWRHDLKMRGYAEAEIEAVFSKYDLDGDRKLDEAELRKMQTDLDGQKIAIKSEYNEMEKTGNKLGIDAYHQKSEGGGGEGGDGPGMGSEEFTLLQRRVDRMEHSIGSIVSKIDAVLVKLEAMERAKAKRRETMGKLLDNITESDGTSDAVKRQQMEKLVREELERWDAEPMLGSSARTPSAGRSSPRSHQDYSSSSA